jgi:hypothetical protein
MMTTSKHTSIAGHFNGNAFFSCRTLCVLPNGAGPGLPFKPSQFISSFLLLPGLTKQPHIGICAFTSKVVGILHYFYYVILLGLAANPIYLSHG